MLQEKVIIMYKPFYLFLCFSYMISITDKRKGQFSKFGMKKKLTSVGGILCVHFLVTVFSSDGI